MPSLIFWGTFFGQLVTCFCLPVGSTQNHSSLENTTDDTQNSNCLNFCMFHTCVHGQCLQNPANCETWCQCSNGFTGTRCDVQQQITLRSPETVQLTSEDLQNAPQAGKRGGIGKVFAKAASLDVSQTIKNFEIFNNLEECTIRCKEGMCTSNDSSIRCVPKNCPTGFDCQNGVCEHRYDRGFRCVCEEGWVGDFCDSKCGRKCGQHGKCVLNNGIETCICDFAHTGKHCEKEVPGRKTVLPFEKSFKHLDECKRECDELCIPLKESFYCMPRRKNCLTGFPCEHYCHIAGRNIQCICEPGWTGDMCSRRCTLECGEHGTCYVDYKGKELCVCDIKYTGKQCEQQTLLNNLN